MKPLVREVRSQLPPFIQGWLDEDSLLIGDNLTRSLQSAIQADSDFLVIFLDQAAVDSSWVRAELCWALAKEDELKRPFVLPVLLQDEIQPQLESIKLRERLFLRCHDFSEDAIRLFTQKLQNHLAAWIDRDWNRLRATSPTVQLTRSSMQVLDAADQYLLRVGEAIRYLVHSHDRENPLEIKELFLRLGVKPELEISSEEQLHELLDRLRQRGHLAGLASDGVSIYVEEEHYGWKTTLFRDLKKSIAQRAVGHIRSGDVVVLDAGSTTFEIAYQIARGIKLQRWRSLSVVTNSITAGYHLMQMADTLGLDDDNGVIDVYVAGGRVRSNTLAIVESGGGAAVSNLGAIIDELGGADHAFVGTNGIFWPQGFTTRDASEQSTKATMLSRARNRYIVTDPSKFGVRQGCAFAGFEEGITIVTARGENDSRVEEYEHLLSETSTKILFAS